MPCNCGKAKAGSKAFVYVDKWGVASKPTTEVQAKAMQIRAGGEGQVKTL